MKTNQFISFSLSTGILCEGNFYLCFFTLINYLNVYLGNNSSIFIEAWVKKIQIFLRVLRNNLSPNQCYIRKDFSTMIRLLFRFLRKDVSCLKLNIKTQFRCPKLSIMFICVYYTTGKQLWGSQKMNETKIDVQESNMSKEFCEVLT